MKPLDRQKLDVVNQTRSNIFGWRGQFTPELPKVSFIGFTGTPSGDKNTNIALVAEDLVRYWNSRNSRPVVLPCAEPWFYTRPAS